MPSQKSTMSSLVETTALPKITIKAQGGEPQVDAYVNAYIVGHQKELIQGGRATPLYYLSLIAPYGYGTVLQAIFARLVSSTSKGRGVELEGVGEVMLAHQQVRLNECGYSLHWNYEQVEVQPHHDLHAVIESPMLTICDPVRGATIRQRTSRHAGRRGRKKQRKEQTSLTTAKKSNAAQSVSEMHARERFPLFLLLIPGWGSQDVPWKHQLHFSFLDPRLPWPLDPSWAEFLWERAEACHEIERLTSWCYTPDQETTPFLSEAYFCRPNPARLQGDLSEALETGYLNTRLHTHLLALPSVPPQHEIPDQQLVATR
ncbi:hypothetical protein [Ktedonospora formicarum]|uniref:Uncharacterized protein n=1 Tax=Ktedonospora formicarum TaxID=2778364 RepID=A0A8J3I4C4_9CHLR|nr:hypothetical protein [Ktedonospora formicarum]GHO49169.1 hypothetical protein KSX_73320 [Ktedonospora formicarum]